MEVSVPITVVLAVGLDSWLLATHSPGWQSEGCVVIAAASIQEAIDHFKAGDFDLVLVGDSISIENKTRLESLIRASGSQTPVLGIDDPPADSSLIANATLSQVPAALLIRIGELIAAKAKPQKPAAILYGNTN